MYNLVFISFVIFFFFQGEVGCLSAYLIILIVEKRNSNVSDCLFPLPSF